MYLEADHGQPDNDTEELMDRLAYLEQTEDDIRYAEFAAAYQEDAEAAF
jgi:hypothetical protein